MSSRKFYICHKNVLVFAPRTCQYIKTFDQIRSILRPLIHRQLSNKDIMADQCLLIISALIEMERAATRSQLEPRGWSPDVKLILMCERGSRPSRASWVISDIRGRFMFLTYDLCLSSTTVNKLPSSPAPRGPSELTTHRSLPNKSQTALDPHEVAVDSGEESISSGWFSGSYITTYCTWRGGMSLALMIH